MKPNNLFKILLGLFSIFLMSNAFSAKPLWTFTLGPNANPTQTVPANGTASVLYIVQNQSYKSKRLGILPTPGVTQTLPCNLAPKGQAGSSCLLNVVINGSEIPPQGIRGGPLLCQLNPDNTPNPNQCYQPSQGQTLNITKGEAVGAVISADRQIVFIPVDGTSADLIITNESSSLEAAQNITANLPPEVTLNSTTCQGAIAPGDSCTFSFSSSTTGGPFPITISADNSNTIAIAAIVTDEAVLSITSPTQENRTLEVGQGNTLTLVVTNISSFGAPALNVTGTPDANCSPVIIPDQSCAIVQPGDTCSLSITTVEPFIPCIITVEGDNAANTPTTPIAFTISGDYVVEVDATEAKVVNAADVSSVPWDSSNACANDATQCEGIPGAESLTDGLSNTIAIINALTGKPGVSAGNYAASLCDELPQNDWYLPAFNELINIHNLLCRSNNQCVFGDFTSSYYWSSSQTTISSALAWVVQFPNINPQTGFNKSVAFPVRCVTNIPLPII